MASALAGATSGQAQMRSYFAEEARQGVASDGRFFYAIDNSRIGQYRIDSGQKISEWQGDPKSFPHINSCTLVGDELACASSNYPALPQRSTVEFFGLNPIRHLRSVVLDATPGSLTAMDRHKGSWWAAFANYDEKGSEPGHDHRDTWLVQYDDDFHALRRWTFPDEVLRRFAPSSCSGLSWAGSGLLLASGHDRPEIYVLRLPETGNILDHVATLPVASHGQAIDMDPTKPDILWSIDRNSKRVLASKLKLGGLPEELTSGR
ncbi:MAG: hypothetical protein AB7U35_08345 [Sphingobium sp.]